MPNFLYFVISCILRSALHLTVLLQYKLGSFPVKSKCLYAAFERHCEEGLVKRVSTTHLEGEKFLVLKQGCDTKHSFRVSSGGALQPVLFYFFVCYIYPLTRCYIL